jgi:hypothetical protein
MLGHLLSLCWQSHQVLSLALSHLSWLSCLHCSHTNVIVSPFPPVLVTVRVVRDGTRNYTQRTRTNAQGIVTRVRSHAPDVPGRLLPLPVPAMILIPQSVVVTQCHQTRPLCPSVIASKTLAWFGYPLIPIRGRSCLYVALSTITVPATMTDIMMANNNQPGHWSRSRAPIRILLLRHPDPRCLPRP